MSVRTNGAWRTVAGFVPSFSATADSAAYGRRLGNAPNQTITSTTAAITVSGGQSPYSYAWERASGDIRISANTPSSAATSFSGIVGADDAIAAFGWTAHDAGGATATGVVEVELDGSINTGNQ